MRWRPRRGIHGVERGERSENHQAITGFSEALVEFKRVNFSVDMER